MKLTLTLLILFIQSHFFAQNWTQVWQSNGTSTAICQGLTVDKNNEVFLSGTFQNQIIFGNKILTAIGETDIFLCKTRESGSVAWAKEYGSVEKDELTNMTSDADGNLILIGNYQQTIDFEQIKLNTFDNLSAIFVVKFNPTGDALWGKSLNGGGLKNAMDVVCDAAGNVFVTGYFSDSLQVSDTILMAQGETDLFVSKFNSEGQLQWALQQGKTGDTRGTALNVTSNGDLILAGFFNDTTEIADTILTANTADQDIFLTRISKNGVPLWAKKAGGVFDSEVTGLVLDKLDNIYLTGYFVGQLRLSDNLRIQSSTGNSDFFLLKYQSNGTPLSARAFGGTLLQQATDIAIQDSLLILTGFYQGDMNLDGFLFTTPLNTISGFVAAFDPNLICQWTKNIVSDHSIYTTRLALDSKREIYVTGSFNGKATFGNKILNSTNAFNMFVAKLQQNVTYSKSIESNPIFKIFPNPTNGQVTIQTDIQQFTIRVANSSGRQVFTGENTLTLDFSYLPNGTYFLTFQTNFISQTQAVVW